MVGFAKIQIGKEGLTEGTIANLNNQFKKHTTVKVTVLKAARSEGKDSVKKISEELLDKLGKNYTARAIGFTIALKKWRKARE